MSGTEDTGVTITGTELDRLVSCGTKTRTRRLNCTSCCVRIEQEDGVASYRREPTWVVDKEIGIAIESSNREDCLAVDPCMMLD